MKFISDYHIHTTFSDGKGAPEDYVLKAIESGIPEIGFSDHLTLTGEQQAWAIKPERLEEYALAIEELRQKYPRVRILLGLEVDYIPGIEGLIREATGDLPLDYIIGSVHYLGEKTVDIGPDFYLGKNIATLWNKYFDMVGTAAESGLFDLIAHPDLIRIFGFFPPSDRHHLYSKLAARLKEADVAIELNTNGRNKPIGDFYPDREFLHLFREAGVNICINSDAHSPEKVGQYFEEAYKLVRETGWEEVAAWEKRKRRMVPLFPLQIQMLYKYLKTNYYEDHSACDLCFLTHPRSGRLTQVV